MVRASRSLMLCPHCNAPSIIRSSDRVTATVKDLFMICSNADCGHTWKAQISVVYTLSPSATPNPAVDIPPAPDDYQRRRFPAGARESGHDPGDSDQISIFDHLDQTAA
jgi:hypothetical protein